MTPPGAAPVALVTGGSRGIGAAVVNLLARDGFDVAFCYQSSDAESERVAGAARRLGSRALACRADVSDADQVVAFVDQAAKTLGPPSAVVTCAGIIRDSLLPRMRDDQWQDVIEVNLEGTVNVCRAVAGLLRGQGAGSIVTLSSVAGRYGNGGQVNYSASKAAIIGFTQAFAQEYGASGVRANVVCPGLIDTDMTRNLSERVLADIRQQIPLGRLGTAAEVAELVAFLVSDRAAYVTGQVLGVDGGIAG